MENLSAILVTLKKTLHVDIQTWWRRLSSGW